MLASFRSCRLNYAVMPVQLAEIRPLVWLSIINLHNVMQPWHLKSYRHGNGISISLSTLDIFLGPLPDFTSMPRKRINLQHNKASLGAHITNCESEL